MFENVFLLDFLKNPILLALLFAVVRNIGGYLTAIFKEKKPLKYEPAKFLETLTLYETFFVALMGLTSLPVEYVAGIVVLVDVLRSVKEASKLISVK